MSANEVFVQALADATGRVIEVSPVLEATTLGAGFLAGMAVGVWKDESDVAAAYVGPSDRWSPASTSETRGARRSAGWPHEPEPSARSPSSRGSTSDQPSSARNASPNDDPAKSRGRNAMNWRGLPMARAARSRPSRP